MHFTKKIYTLSVIAFIAIAYAKNSTADKLILESYLFLNTPYTLFPLGEGKNADISTKPLYTFTTFDCLTFVETMLALAHEPKDFLTTLTDIRYHSNKPSFISRNHFMSTEWNYYNQKKGYITDITTKIYNKNHKTLYQTVSTLIDKPSWLRFIAEHPRLMAKYTTNSNHTEISTKLLTYATRSLAQVTKVPYIALPDLIDENHDIDPIIYQQLPEIFIVETVRKNWQLKDKIGTDLDISHIGFGIKTKHGLIFRHASDIKGYVLDTPFISYFTKQAKQKSFAGINIEAVYAG